MIAERFDVAVIGGGLVGASTAFFLTRRGKRVVLIEAERVGRHASGTNFGNVRRQGRPAYQMPLATRALGVWRQLPELIGDDCLYKPKGHLRLALDDRQAQRLAAYAATVAEHGLGLELIDGAEARRRFPFVGPEVVAASWSPSDGDANPRLTAPAFARAAVAAGAVLIEGVAVAAAEKAGADFVLALADGREVRAGVLVNAAGAWAGAFAAGFGDAVPLTPKGPQMMVTEPAPAFIAPAVGHITEDPQLMVYFRQTSRGNVVMGGPKHCPVSAETRRATALPENILLQARAVTRLAPALARLRVIRTWGGVEGYTSDDEPVIGESRRVAGLFHAFGFSGGGFQLAPGVGDVMAELIATGGTDVPLDRFAPERFATT